MKSDLQNVVSRLTPAQMRVLKTAINDGEIIFGGMDKTPNVRIDVVRRLVEAGALKFKVPNGHFETSAWEPTELGRKLAF